MAIEFSSVLDSGDVDSNTTEAVKRQGGLEISDVTDLQTTLDNKSDVGHSHAISDVTDLQSALDGKVGSTDVTTIEVMTQSEYDGITPDANTLYVIVG